MLNPTTVDLLPQPTKARPVIDDGVIKFKLTLKMSRSLEAADILPLEKWRALLWRMNFIGEYPIEKIGYGNISQRLPSPKNAFIISGTQTGQWPHLKREHYTRVVQCDLGKNAIWAEGPIAPSSESLTHYAIYEAAPQVQAIFHAHHPQIWAKLIETGAPAISEDIPYGTREMAEAARDLIAGSDEGLFVMKGHQDGLIAYGATPDAAGKILMKLYKDLGPFSDL